MNRRWYIRISIPLIRALHRRDDDFLVRVRCEANERFIDESRERGRSPLFLEKSDEKRRMSDFNKPIRVHSSTGGERTGDRFVELIPANCRLTSYFCVQSIR